MATLKSSKTASTFDTATGKVSFGTAPIPTLSPNAQNIPMMQMAGTTNIIPAPTLNSPQQPLGIPSVTNNATPALQGTLEAYLQNQQVQQQKASELAQAQLENQSDDIVKNILSIGSAANTIDRTEQDIAKKKSDAFTAQIEQEQLANRRQIESLQKNNQGLFGGALEDKINQVSRDSLSKQADLAILQTAANRDYETAASIADRQLQNKLEPLKAQLDARKFLYENNKDLFDKADQAKLKTEERQYEKYAQDQKDISDLKLTLAKNGAPASVLALVTDAEDLSEALNNPKINNYFTSPADKLDLELKKASLANTRSITRERDNAVKEPKPATQPEILASGFAQRVVSANQTLNEIGAQFASASSLGASKLPNILKSADRQVYEQAQRNFVNSILRRESGAAISPTEFKSAETQYFPQPGDSEAVIQQKSRNRNIVQRNLIQSAGSAYTPVDNYLDGSVIPAISVTETSVTPVSRWTSQLMAGNSNSFK